MYGKPSNSVDLFLNSTKLYLKASYGKVWIDFTPSEYHSNYSPQSLFSKITVSVLGLDLSFTVKYTPSPSGVLEGKSFMSNNDGFKSNNDGTHFVK